MTNEPFIPFDQLEKELNNLKILLNENDAENTKILLDKLLKNYKSNSNLIDHIYGEKLLNKKYEQNSDSSIIESNKNADNFGVIKLIK